MTIHQGDMAWRQLRVGDVTASRFGDVIATAKTSSRYEIVNLGGKTKNKNWTITLDGEVVKGGFETKAEAEDERKPLDAVDREGQLAKSAEVYLCELLYERATGHPIVTAETQAMAWGTEWEETARLRAAEAIRRKWGDLLYLPEDQFAYMPHHSESRVGCSPDFVVGDDAGGEIKCSFNPSRHFQILRDPDAFMRRHKAQVQGAMWCRNWKYYYIVSYDHRLESLGLDLWIRQVIRDDEWITKVLEPRVLRFRDRVEQEFLQITEQPF